MGYEANTGAGCARRGCKAYGDQILMAQYHPLDLARLAAFIDGEGCISSVSSKGYIYPQLSIGNTDIRLGMWLTETFGGHAYGREPANEKWKVLYLWKPEANRIKELLLMVLPYLLLKQEQAAVAIAMFGVDHNQRQPLHDKLSQLNKKGIE
jgi:hypothetical protein